MKSGADKWWKGALEGCSLFLGEARHSLMSSVMESWSQVHGGPFLSTPPPVLTWDLVQWPMVAFTARIIFHIVWAIVSCTLIYISLWFIIVWISFCLCCVFLCCFLAFCLSFFLPAHPAIHRSKSHLSISRRYVGDRDPSHNICKNKQFCLYPDKNVHLVPWNDSFHFGKVNPSCWWPESRTIYGT